MATILNRFSLKTIILGGSLVAALTPAAILGIGSAQQISSMVFNDRIEDQVRLAQTLARRFDDFLTMHRQAVSGFAKMAERLPKIDQSSAAPIFNRLLASFPSLQRVSLIDPKGIAYASFPEDGTTTAGLSYTNRDWFQEITKTKQPYVSRDITVGRLTGRVSVSIAVPILDSNEGLRGIATATINVKSIQDAVASIRRQATGSVAVATGEGRIIAHEQAALAQQHADISKHAFWERMTRRAAGIVEAYSDETGAVRVAGYATVPSSGWKVWVHQTRAEIDDQVAGVFWQVVPWFAAAVVLALVTAGIMANRIFRPIEDLRTTAVAISDGDFNRRATETGARELTVLARTVNGMAETLQRNILAEQATKMELQRTVREFGDVAASVAAGNLSVRIAETGEGELGRLGQSLNRMIEALFDMVGEIRSAADSVASASAEILAATSQQVSAIAEEATAVRQTATTVAEVRKAAELTAHKTRSVSELAQRMTAIAEDGQRSVEESVFGSEEAKTRIEALAERILSFSTQAEAIAEINATVSELASQSNLLAVNAGIEAAKAGEAGRGFAVVAAEVKGLAERCKDATVQVRQIVTEIQKSAQATVIAAEQGVKASEAGASIARRSGSAIATLAQSVTEASQAAQQIMAAADQQESGMDQISIAMQNIEQSSAQTVATMSQVETAARNLDELAQKLTAIIKATTSEAA